MNNKHNKIYFTLYLTVVILLLGLSKVQAQYYVNVLKKDGGLRKYAVEQIDSIYYTSTMIYNYYSNSYEPYFFMNIAKNNGDKYVFETEGVDSLFFSDIAPYFSFEYVDLGLSSNWATCNIGANYPEESGDFFAWGEIEAKNSFYPTDYKFTNNISGDFVTYSKYHDDGKRSLDLEDDAANVILGGNWRLPNDIDLEELGKNCTSIWTERNGVKGIEYTSIVPGFENNSIFFPASGIFDGTNTKRYYNMFGYYWTNYIHIASYDFNPYFFRINNGFYSDNIRHFYRYYGLSIRPVTPSKDWLSYLHLIMDPSEISLLPRKRHWLKAIIMRGDYEYPNEDINTRISKNDSRLVWSSNNTSVATIDNSGQITTLSPGTAIITAFLDTIFTQCVVTVVDESTIEHEYVDLGLSVNWATCNLGAESIQDYGDYYAWGETSVKPERTYDWVTYKYCNGTYNELTKYCSDKQFGYNGYYDDKTILEPSDDAAKVVWGEEWRMPSKEEFNELLDSCTWRWINNSEVDGIFYGRGFLITSRVKGYTDKSIFLPAAGYHDMYGLQEAGKTCYYWSNSLDTLSTTGAFGYSFSEYKYFNDSRFTRSKGATIRPVFSSKE